jgi:hypothetical protein
MVRPMRRSVGRDVHSDGLQLDGGSMRMRDVPEIATANGVVRHPPCARRIEGNHARLG